jgi:glucose/arabinose dehydrogenase
MRLAALAAALCLAGTAAAQPTLPSGFYVEDAAGGAVFDAPVALAFAPDGRMLVAEKRGVVWVVEDGVRLPDPFIDRSAEVLDHWDRGLLGLAVDGAGRVLLLYTVDHDGSGDYEREDVFGRLTRYSPLPGDPNVADPASRRVLVGETFAEGFPNCFWSHAIGTVVVAPDGTLLVGSGDGADFRRVDPGGFYPDCFGPGRFPASEDIGAFRSLRLQSLAGKILRLDPETGEGLPSNPFWTGDGDDAPSKVWAFGFRNPYRFGLRPGGSTDPADGAPGLLVVGDVGWETWEELDVVHGGENHAWPCREGPNEQSGYQNANPPTNGCDSLPPYDGPVAYWHHGLGGLSNPPGRTAAALVGGAFYDGDRYPAAYAGAYFYGDYVYGWTAVAYLDAGGAFVGDAPFSPDTGLIVDYEYDPATRLVHLVDLAAGRVYRLRHTGGDANHPPVAAASADPPQGSVPLAVAFSSAGTFDPDGDVLTYHWDFGNGGASTAPNPTHTYTEAGHYTAVLTVRDAYAAAATAEVEVTATVPPAGEGPAAAVPFGVEAVFPEPSDGRLTVRLGLDRPGRLRVEAFDVLGRRVLLRDVAAQAAGRVAVPVDLGPVPGGLYVLRVHHLGTGAAHARRFTVAR